jgi:tetratricopeptide (TPR) repeat protein
VGVSIAIGSRTYNRELLQSLPALLAPFAPLSPLIEAVRRNAMASLDMSGDCRFEQARARWLEVYDMLLGIDAVETPPVLMFRSAIAHAIAFLEVRMSLDSAGKWLDLLDRDPTQRVSALYLRKVISLNQGDSEGAERWRKQAEILALQTPTHQMFASGAIAELWAHAATGDLVGVNQTLDRIAPLSARYPGWAAFLPLAEGQFQSARGDMSAALAAFERCLELCTPDAGPQPRKHSIAAWPSCVGSYVEVLQRVGRVDDARTFAERALQRCEELGIGVCSHEIARGLALAEARLGEIDRAWPRLERLLEAQEALGVKGLPLGATYEACARVAIWTGDAARLERFSRLTAIEYRYGHDSPLGARYERLMEEARQAGATALPELGDFVSTAIAGSSHALTMTAVLESMVGATSRTERGRHVLRVLCEARGASAGYLYLSTTEGIALAASLGSDQPPDGLSAFLESYLCVEREQADSATVIVTAAQLDAEPAVASWTDPTGRVHHPMVLTCTVDAEARQVAVASFVNEGNLQRTAIDAQLSARLAACLVESDDRKIGKS